MKNMDLDHLRAEYARQVLVKMGVIKDYGPIDTSFYGSVSGLLKIKKEYLHRPGILFYLNSLDFPKNHRIF